MDAKSLALLAFQVPARASGLKAFAVRFGAACLRVVMRSKVWIASVGSSTSARAGRYRLLAANETSRNIQDGRSVWDRNATELRLLLPLRLSSRSSMT